jgi:hypothetical protein
MKPWSLFLFCSWLCAGCSTTQNVESRIQERRVAYENLKPEVKDAVDQGQLRHGMDTNAVYMAWGEPSEVLPNETSAIWIYQENGWREEKTTTWRTVQSTGLGSSGISVFPEETRSLYPEKRVRARVLFEHGKVAEWQILPGRPAN